MIKRPDSDSSLAYSISMHTINYWTGITSFRCVLAVVLVVVAGIEANKIFL